MTGLRAIWKGAGNKFYVMLFVLLSATSVLLLFRLRREISFLISTVLFGGVILFLLLALLALIPQFNKLLHPVERSNATRLASFIVTIFLAIVVFLLPFRIDYMLAYFGFLLWLVVQALLSCSVAYSLSDKLSSHRPRILGWVFVALAFLAQVLVYLWVRSIPVVYPLFLFYTLAWFAPCIILGFANYRNPRSFSTYCLIALIYTLFPVVYRIYSLLDDVAVKSGGASIFAARLPIEGLITIAFFIWALNGIGKLLIRRHDKTDVGERHLASKLRDSSQEQRGQSRDTTGTDTSAVRADGSTLRREPMLGLFLVFGLLFSALAYFVFVNAASPLGIPDYLESIVAYTFSILATVPLLFYIGLKKNQTS